MEKELNLRKEVSKMEQVAELTTAPHSKEEEINVDTSTMNAFSSALAHVADSNTEEQGAMPELGGQPTISEGQMMSKLIGKTAKESLFQNSRFLVQTKSKGPEDNAMVQLQSAGLASLLEGVEEDGLASVEIDSGDGDGEKPLGEAQSS